MAKVKEKSRKKGRQKILLKSGAEFTPELEEELAAEAERGYDLSKAERHFLRQPVLADGDSRPKITFPLSVAELNAARRRAEDEGRTLSALAREALTKYMES